MGHQRHPISPLIRNKTQQGDINQEKEKRHTGQSKQDQPINDQDGPKDGDIEELEPSADEADDERSRGRIPELKLRQASNERSELLILLGGKPTD